MDEDTCPICQEDDCEGKEDPSQAHENLSVLQPSLHALDEFYRMAVDELVALGATFDAADANKDAKDQGYEDWSTAEWAHEVLRSVEESVPEGLVVHPGDDNWSVWRI